MSLDVDSGRVRAALESIADPAERERTIEAFDRIVVALNDMEFRIQTARASLADMREQLESQMEFWRPTKDEA